MRDRERDRELDRKLECELERERVLLDLTREPAGEGISNNEGMP